jgi:hypothetical protein
VRRFVTAASASILSFHHPPPNAVRRLDVTLSDARRDVVQWRIAGTPPPQGSCSNNDEQRNGSPKKKRATLRRFRAIGRIHVAAGAGVGADFMQFFMKSRRASPGSSF